MIWANKNNMYKAILFLLPFIYTLLFGRYGFEDSDSGFIVGLGWRILNGELPYRDFYYVRPPLSPCLSAFFLYVLPEYGQLFYIRFLTYVIMLLTILMTTDVLDKFYNFKELNLNKYLFSIISFFILSIGHLDFQWPTTDGIFFAILGLWILVSYKDNFFLVVLAGILFALSALAKQNFMTIPVLALIFTFLTYGKKLGVLVFFGIIINFLIFYLWLDSNSLVELFINQTTGVTSVKDLIKAGFLNYFISDKALLGLVSLISIILMFVHRFYNKFFNIKFISFLILCTIVLINLSYIIYTQTSGKLIRFDLTFPVIVTLYFIYLFVSKKEKLKNHYILAFLFAIAWSSSISWGYNTPILFFIPILFGIIFILSKHYKFLNSYKYNLAFIVLIIVYSIPYNLFPYRDKPIWLLHSNAVEISDKAAFIITNKNIIAKHKELSKLLKDYPKSTVLPSVPLAYYLNNLNNNFKIDWAMDVEAGYDIDGLIKNINECCQYCIVEKKLFGQPIGKSGKFYSSITDYVINNFTLIDNKNQFFDIYKSK